jgi:hypothetical protein
MLTNIEEYYKMDCGRYLCFLNHPLERYLERVRMDSGLVIKNQVIRIANDLATRIISLSNDEPGFYGVHSNSTGIGFVVDWREDTTNPPVNALNHAWMMTFFPIKKYHHFKSEDTVYIVNRILKDAVDKIKIGKHYFFNANNSLPRFIQDNLPHKKSSESRFLGVFSGVNNQSLVVSFQGDEMIENNIREFYLVD